MSVDVPQPRNWPDYVVIGRVLRPHGIGGALRIVPLSDHPNRFEKNRRVYLSHQGQNRQSFTIDHARLIEVGRMILQLKEITSRNDAEQWRGALVEIPGTEVPPLPQGEHYVFELIGLVVETNSGRQIGKLHDIQYYPWHNIFVVRNEQREYLIPAVADLIIKIDKQTGRMIINDIEGLLD